MMSDAEIKKARQQFLDELAKNVSQKLPENIVSPEEEATTWVEVTFHLRSGRDVMAQMRIDKYVSFRFNSDWEYYTFYWEDDCRCGYWLEVWQKDVEAISTKELE